MNIINEEKSVAGIKGLDSILQSLGKDGVQAVLQVLKGDAGGSAVVKNILSGAALPTEQQAIVDLLFSLNESMESDGELLDGNFDQDIDINNDSDEELYDDEFVDVDDEGDAQNHVDNVYDIQVFKRELIDLRKVNDTLAAALGACPVCWGGDSECDECYGEGNSGAYEPDVRLFNELVAPVVRKVRTMKRSRNKLVRERR